MEYLKTWICKKLLYPAYNYKYGCRVIRILNSLKNSQWLSQEELLNYQLEKLKKLVTHAFEKVPYYRQILNDINLNPGDIKNIGDLQYLPILTKDIVRKNYDKLISEDIKCRRVFRGSTGGSTGEPLKFIRDVNTIVWAEAALLRGKSWAQYEIGDKVINFMSVGKPSFLGNSRERLINNYTFPAFEKEEELLQYIKKIRRIKPYCFVSYASNLYRIAQILNNNGINDIKVPIIFSTGEMLYDYQKGFIERQFGGKVFDYYGCNEIGSLAYECEYNRKHVSDEHVIIETTDSYGNPIINSSGEFTITDLDNYAMPFIRYKNGDAGILTDDGCNCSRGLKIIKNVEGRTQDFLRTIDGNHIPAIFFPSRFRNLNGLSQYQIIQEDILNTTLRIVKNDFFSIDELNEMVRVIKMMLGDTVNIKVEETEHINLTPRGKNRLVISRITENFAQDSNG